MPPFLRPFRTVLLVALVMRIPDCLTAQSAPDQPVDMREVMKSGKPPKPIKRPAPVYPPALAQSGLSGSVVVVFIVDTRGDVQNPGVVKSSHPGFEPAAIEAILGWKYQPAEMNGHPVSTRVGQTLLFALNQEGRAAEHPLAAEIKITRRPAPAGATRLFDKPARPIKQKPPAYPPGMARAGLIGAVKVAFTVDREGLVRDAYVVESNNPWFERPAVDAITSWKFQPAEKDGHPVDMRTEQLMVFDLDTGGRLPEFWQVAKGKDHNQQPPEFQWETPPSPKSTLFPVYPLELLQAGTEGEARVSYVVGPNGEVIGAKVQEATKPEFGLAVLAMIDGWRFKPAQKKDGTPAFARLGIEYRFRTNGRGEVPVSDQARWILQDLKKAPDRIVGTRELDQPLKPVARRPPVYPSALAKAGQPGNAVIEFFVDAHGDTQLPHIISSTAPEFGYAAVQAVATWRFEPAHKDGKPVVTRVRIPIDFMVPGH